MVDWKKLSAVGLGTLVVGGFGGALLDGNSYSSDDLQKAKEDAYNQGQADFAPQVVEVAKEVPAQFIDVDGVQYDKEDINTLLGLEDQTVDSYIQKARADALAKFYKIDTPDTHEYELNEFQVNDWGDATFEFTDLEDGEYSVTFSDVEIEYDDGDDNEEEKTYDITVEYDGDETPKVT